MRRPCINDVHPPSHIVGGVVKLNALMVVCICIRSSRTIGFHLGIQWRAEQSATQPPADAVLEREEEGAPSVLRNSSSGGV